MGQRSNCVIQRVGDLLSLQGRDPSVQGGDHRVGDHLSLQLGAVQLVPEDSLLTKVLVLLVLLQCVLPPEVGWLQGLGDVGAMLVEDKEGCKDWQENSRGDQERADDVRPRLKIRLHRQPLPVGEGHSKELWKKRDCQSCGGTFSTKLIKKISPQQGQQV